MEEPTQSSSTPAPDAQPALVQVAYHAGPESIGFCGRNWARSVAQELTHEEWARMQERGDFAEFNFTEEH